MDFDQVLSYLLDLLDLLFIHVSSLLSQTGLAILDLLNLLSYSKLDLLLNFSYVFSEASSHVMFYHILYVPGYLDAICFGDAEFSFHFFPLESFSEAHV